MKDICVPRRCAFAICAMGDRFKAYRENAVRALARYVPEADIIDMDLSRTGDILDNIPDKDKAQFARLAIPLMDDFRKYDIVVWVDADVDVISRSFSGIFDVETSDDGLAAALDRNQQDTISKIKNYFPAWNKTRYFNSGVLVMDLHKIDPQDWRRRVLNGIEVHNQKKFWTKDQDILNGLFDIKEIDVRFNWVPSMAEVPGGPWLVHYTGPGTKKRLDSLVQMRSKIKTSRVWKDRCVVVSPRHDFIRPWIRAYFSSGNTIPLVIVPGPPGDWRDDDMEYCQNAARFSGGIVFDCSAEWRDSAKLSERAVRKNVGWYTKKSILHAVATRLEPKSWAWIDDDAEVTGNLDECFDYADRTPGFICSQFYIPNEIDNRHPAAMYRTNIDPDDKVCWNSLVFFHGNANKMLTEELCKEFPIEDDEIIFGYLYKNSPVWHEGFCDFSIRGWQKNCKHLRDIPGKWNGKLLHYTANHDGRAVKKMWAAKAYTLPKAQFEQFDKPCAIYDDDGPVDAVFVIGTGSINDNEELRYALRNIDAHCKFIRDVYICGYCPPWVDRSKVKHLQWPDRFTHAKDANIIDKLRHACEHPGIAKRILFCSDDQFQTRECSWEDFVPRYLRRYVSGDTWYEGRHRVWHTRLEHTLEREVQRRISSGMDAKDVFYYQPHIWMPIDRDSFISYAKWCGYERREDTIIASGYFNFINAKGKPDFDHSFLRGGSRDVPKTTHIAYHDSSYDVAMKMLKKMFPSKCRFEISSHVNSVPSRVRPSIPPPVRTNNPSDDPSRASPDEISRILGVMSQIRSNVVWHNLLGEVSRAEEMRLFCARGWRTVWNDIIKRWSEATCNGSDRVPVDTSKSKEAKAALDAYISNPNATRTATYGPQPPRMTPISSRQLPRMPGIERSGGNLRDSIRGKIGTSLRLRGK